MASWFEQNLPQMQPSGGGAFPETGGITGYSPSTGRMWGAGGGILDPSQIQPIPAAGGMQPGGGGFQEAQAGAVPLPNTGVTGPMDGGPFGGLSQLGGLMQQAGVPSSGMFGNVMRGAASQLPQALQQQQAIGQMSPYQLMQTAGVPTRGAFGSILGRLMPQAQQAMSGGMGNVLLRAPDGSTKSVPAGEMQHWLGRGAVRF